MDNIKLDFQATYKVRQNSASTADTTVLLYTEHRTLGTATGISNIASLLIDCEWYCGMPVPAAVQRTST